MTLDQLYEAADQYADKYDDRFQKIARQAFIEAVAWAAEVDAGSIKVETR